MERAIDAPPASVRLFFLYGPDEAGAAAYASRLEKAMGAQAERIDLDGATLKSDPARLADEAASFSMFGDKRWVRITACGDEILPAVEALLEAEQAGNPVIALAGALKGTSKLVKLALDHPAVLAQAIYPLGDRDATQLAMAMAQERGLRLHQPLARRLVELTGGDRALMGGEIEKMALYLDALPEHPAEATDEVFDALSAETIDADMGPLVNAVLGGDIDRMQHELAMLDLRGASLAGVMRPLIGRAMLIADIRADFEEMGRLDAAMDKAGKAIFWKEKPAVQAQVKRWNSGAITRAVERLAHAERATRDSKHAGEIVARNELLTVARQAARERP